RRLARTDGEGAQHRGGHARQGHAAGAGAHAPPYGDVRVPRRGARVGRGSDHGVVTASTGAGGSASAGGCSRAACSRSRKSTTVFALASRYVSRGRFHLASIVASTEVWSWTTFVTAFGLEYGEATTAGTRGP